MGLCLLLFEHWIPVQQLLRPRRDHLPFLVQFRQLQCVDSWRHINQLPTSTPQNGNAVQRSPISCRCLPYLLALELGPQLDEPCLSLRQDRPPEVEKNFESGGPRLIEELKAACGGAVH